MVQEEGSFKDISYLWLWRPFCSVLPKHLCNYDSASGDYLEHFCEIILNLEQWLKGKCRLKTVLIYSSGGAFVQHGRTICAVLTRAL